MIRKQVFDKLPLWIATRQIHFNKDMRYQPTTDTERLLYEVADRSKISNKFDQTEEAFSCILDAANASGHGHPSRTVQKAHV